MELPVSFRLFVLYLIWIAWFLLLDYNQKKKGFVAASIFAVVEYVYTSFTHPKGYTTFAQFWVAMLYWPLMIGPYRNFVSGYHNTGDLFLRILLFPFLIWFMEICEGYLLIFVYGRNTAWEYSPKEPRKNANSSILTGIWLGEDVFFHGNIKLGHYKLWWALGIIYEIGSVIYNEHS